jgi:protein SCO1/2
MLKTPLILGSIFLIFVFGAYWLSNSSIEKSKSRLPVINPNDVNPELVDESMQGVGRGHTIRYFDLKNQLGESVTGKELDGKIYVADFFFTTCGGICPKMTKELQRVQQEFAKDDRVMIVSHTVTPERDSVEVLKRYADKYGADHKKWLFLTGDKKEIYGLARRAYFIVKEAKEGEDDGSGSDFIHTENFVLIDSKKRIRGYYSGIRPSSVDSLMNDMKLLLKE